MTVGGRRRRRKLERGGARDGRSGDRLVEARNWRGDGVVLHESKSGARRDQGVAQIECGILLNVETEISKFPNTTISVPPRVAAEVIGDQRFEYGV